MDPDLLRILVPLGIFAFWAISKLSERNVKPLESRPRQRVEDDPFRAPATVTPQPRPQTPAIRWRETPQTMGMGMPQARPDEIVILGSADARPLRSNPPARRNAGRQRPQQARPREQAPAPAKKRLSDVNQQVSQQIKESMTIQPLHLSAQPLTTRVTEVSATRPDLGGSTRVDVLSLQAAARDPVRLREALILNEILQPPLALRNRPRG